jgi:hypothetical protein
MDGRRTDATAAASVAADVGLTMQMVAVVESAPTE